MFKTTRKAFILMLAGANVASVGMMLLCGFSQIVNPKIFSPLVAFGLTFPIYLFVNVAFLLFWAVFSARYIWISIIGIVISFSAVRTYCPLNIPNPHPRGCIKVMSYNVKRFSAGETLRNNHYKEILAYLKKSDADIVCFQESSIPVDIFGRGLENILNRWAYHDSLTMGKENDNTISIYSRFPIIRRTRINVHAPAHGSVAYTLRVGEDTIIVINNHFVSNAISDTDKSLYKNMVEKPGDMSMKTDVHYLVRKIGQAGVKRAEQADSVATFIDHHPNCPIVLCGDFNDSPISYVHYRITRKLKDAYVASAFGPGISYHEAGMYFRLDNILCSRHWRSYSAAVDSHISASDHYPISCYLKLKGN